MKFPAVTATLLILLTCSPVGDCHAQPLIISNTTYTPTAFRVGAGQPSIAVVDFNADGNMDLVVANYSDNNVVVFQGDGKGNLTQTGRFAAGENPTSMAVSDINGDGHPDMVIANHETSYVTVLFGDGLGSFSPSHQSPLRIDSKPHPHAVALHDLDGDSNADLIVDSREHEGLRVLKGLANGRFQTPGRIIKVGGDPYRGFAVKDINGDGWLDLTTPNQRDIAILINARPNNSEFSLKKLTQSASPFAVELADLTGDGAVELLIAGNGNAVTVIPGDGQGNFLQQNKTVIKASPGAKQITTGDINGDGIEDALISSWSGELIAVIGSKSAIATVRFNHPQIENPWGLAMTDLNQDGRSDLIIADGDSELAVVYLSLVN